MYYVSTKRKYKYGIGDLDYVSLHGSKMLANTDESKAETMSNFFTVVK